MGTLVWKLFEFQNKDLLISSFLVRKCYVYCLEACFEDLLVEYAVTDGVRVGLQVFVVDDISTFMNGVEFYVVNLTYPGGLEGSVGNSLKSRFDLQVSWIKVMITDARKVFDVLANRKWGLDFCWDLKKMGIEVILFLSTRRYYLVCIFWLDLCNVYLQGNASEDVGGTKANAWTCSRSFVGFPGVYQVTNDSQDLELLCDNSVLGFRDWVFQSGNSSALSVRLTLVLQGSIIKCEGVYIVSSEDSGEVRGMRVLLVIVAIDEKKSRIWLDMMGFAVVLRSGLYDWRGIAGLKRCLFDIMFGLGLVRIGIASRLGVIRWRFPEQAGKLISISSQVKPADGDALRKMISPDCFFAGAFYSGTEWNYLDQVQASVLLEIPNVGAHLEEIGTSRLVCAEGLSRVDVSWKPKEVVVVGNQMYEARRNVYTGNCVTDFMLAWYVSDRWHWVVRLKMGSVICTENPKFFAGHNCLVVQKIVKPSSWIPMVGFGMQYLENLVLAFDFLVQAAVVNEVVAALLNRLDRVSVGRLDSLCQLILESAPVSGGDRLLSCDWILLVLCCIKIVFLN